MCSDIGYDLRYENLSDRVRDILKTNDSSVIIAADNNEILGWVQVEVCYFILSEKCCNISGIFVDKKYRGRRIGKKLIEEAYKWGKQNNCTGINIHTDIARIDSHDFYKHLGFKHIKTNETYYKSLRDL